MRIIITRPEPFASQLAEALKSAGFADVVCLPCISIESLPPTIIPDPVDIFIFISRNAVIYGHQLIKKETVAAIGLGTKSELECYHTSVDIFPKQPPFNSEALLELPALLNVKNKKITIIKGNEGRELLFNALTTRGATVSCIDVYTRKQPNYPDKELRAVFNNIDNSIAICTSSELLQNLSHLAKKAKLDLSRLQLCVISAKMANDATAAGFTKPAIIADSPNDKDIMWILQSRTKNLNSR